MGWKEELFRYPEALLRREGIIEAEIMTMSAATASPLGTQAKEVYCLKARFREPQSLLNGVVEEARKIGASAASASPQWRDVRTSDRITRYAGGLWPRSDPSGSQGKDTAFIFV